MKQRVFTWLQRLRRACQEHIALAKALDRVVTALCRLTGFGGAWLAGHRTPLTIVLTFFAAISLTLALYDVGKELLQVHENRKDALRPAVNERRSS